MTGDQSVAKTIQIFLPKGDPRGIRVAEITTRIVRVIEVPRSLINDFLKTPEAQQVGVYFLFGDVDDAESPQLYIGQSGGVGDRLVNHNRSKDFWNRALVAVSLTNSLTQTHGLYLEWIAIRDAIAASRYMLENGNAGTQPYTPAPLQADCHEIHDTIGTLIATLGYPAFVPVRKPTANVGAAPELFYCKGPGTSGIGLYTEEGFVVLKGSTGRRESVPSIVGTADDRFRQKLVETGVMKVEGLSVVFTKDHLFGSPSTAAVALQGRTANGWREWKDQNGRTLDELKRQNG
jgi:Domain of unknown function (DUF4357)